MPPEYFLESNCDVRGTCSRGDQQPEQESDPKLQVADQGPEPELCYGSFSFKFYFR